MNFKRTKLYWYLQRKRRKSNIRHKSYSQYGQDLVALELLDNPSHGVFLDIGANDGVSFSNSLLFEERGWTGICVEPHPIIFKTLQEKRNCHLVNACISSSDSMVDFLVVEGPSHMLSGIAQHIDERHQKRIEKDIEKGGGTTRKIQIEALSPKTLLERFTIEKVDFLSIDTEGCELPILKNFDFTKTDVRCISVENGTRSSDIFSYLTSVGYVLERCVGCDEIYIKA